MNKEIVASEFLSKYYRLLWVFRHTEVDACQEGNEFSYLLQVNYLKEFEKIRRPGEDSDLKLLFIQFHLSTVDRNSCQFRSNCGLEVHLAGY